MKKKYTLIALLITFFATTWAQTPNLTWAKQMGGTNNDEALSVVVDGSGNVYTTGSFSGTADFDPGAGTFNMTATGQLDIFISKLDASGNFVWAKQIGGASYDDGFSIAVDASGNAYVTGIFYLTVDFDPGIGVYNLTSAGGGDSFICKLDASGNFVWAKQMGGGGSNDDEGNSVAVDPSSNDIYITGSFSGTVDFDPGTGTYNLTSGGNDAFISKLDSAGNFVWAKQLGGTSAAGAQGFAVAVDGNGNVYTTGQFSDMIDFNPGAGVFNITALGSIDAFISKLDASGNFIWAKNFGAVGGVNLGRGITVDGLGNVFSTGQFTNTTDFDPGVDTFNITDFGNTDSYISKLDASGNFVWAKQLGGAAGGETGYSIALDGSGNVYTIGHFGATADFDPGTGIFNLTSAGNVDIYISKLDASGNFIWAGRMGGTSFDLGNSVFVDASDNVYITGTFNTTVDFDASASVFNMTSAGGDDVYVAKYAPCTVAPIQPTIIFGTTPVCSGISNTYSVSTVSETTSYTWTIPADWSGTSGTNSITITAGITSGDVTVTANNACGSSSPQTLTVTVNPTPVAAYTQSPALVCINATLVTLSAGTPAGGTYAGTSVTGSTFDPATAGAGVFPIEYIYTTAAGCADTATSSITVSACTGIAQNTMDPELHIYPNPFNAIIALSGMEKDAMVEIYNVLGEKIYSEQMINDRAEINMSKQANGIYFIKITTGKGTLTKRIVKQY